jgi:hypothetical protein
VGFFGPRRNRMTEVIPFLAQCQDAAEIGVGGDQGAAFACCPNENLQVRRRLHAIIAHVNRIMSGAPKTFGDRGVTKPIALARIDPPALNKIDLPVRGDQDAPVRIGHNVIPWFLSAPADQPRRAPPKCTRDSSLDFFSSSPINDSDHLVHKHVERIFSPQLLG